MQTSYFPLNSFQQSMVLWTDFTPYNAGHVMLLAGQPDVARWERAILQTLQTLQLGKPVFAENNRLVAYESVAHVSIQEIKEDLDRHIQAELNRPFLKNDFPIRFFILQQQDQYYLGAIYNHWISDSAAMRALFQNMYACYHAEKCETRLMLAAPSFSQVFRAHVGRWPWWNGFKEFLRCTLHFQSVYRTKITDVMDFETGFSRSVLPQGLIARLIAYAKKNNVSINDVFLAALAKVMGDYTSAERQKIKRKKWRFFPRNRLALGAIVDIRHAAQGQLDSVFGQYLSNFTVILKDPEADSFKDLLKNIFAQTDKIKKSFRTIKNFASWDVSLFVWKFLSSRKSQARFFTKHAPVAAGISNVNLNSSWIGKHHDILDYLRISPTGLLLPLVFTLTTLHQHVSLCISYRAAAFKREEVDQFSQLFVETLENNIR